MNSNTDLLLLNFNIRSIGANLDTFNCFTNLLNKKIDIHSFSESWLNDNNKNLYTIEGYEAFHNVRCDGRRGGGLSVYITNVFKSKVIHPCTISLPTVDFGGRNYSAKLRRTWPNRRHSPVHETNNYKNITNCRKLFKKGSLSFLLTKSRYTRTNIGTHAAVIYCDRAQKKGCNYKGYSSR